MNYYIVQATYFLVFVVMAVSAYVVTPVIHSSFLDASDSYVRSKMNHIQAEALFLNKEKKSFRQICYTGTINTLVTEIIQEHGEKVSCKTNDGFTKFVVYARLHSGIYYMVDSLGVSCELYHEPRNIYSCREGGFSY